MGHAHIGRHHLGPLATLDRALTLTASLRVRVRAADGLRAQAIDVSCVLLFLSIILDAQDVALWVFDAAAEGVCHAVVAYLNCVRPPP